MADKDLSPRKQAFVTALMGGMTQEEAAALLGVRPRTCRRYYADPQVRAALAQAQDAALAGVTRKATAAMIGALDTLYAIMQDTRASPSARVAAARAILESGLRFTELVTLAERVTALEQKLNGGAE